MPTGTLISLMQPVETADELELRDYLRVLRRRKWLIAIVAVVVLGVAMAVTLTTTPVYQATASVLLRNRATDSLFLNPQTGYADPNRRLQTEIQVIHGNDVNDLARRLLVAEELGVTEEAAITDLSDELVEETELGFALDVSASPAGQTDVLNIKAQSIVPEVARRVANAYAEAYVQFRQLEESADIESALVPLRARAAELQRQLDELTAENGRTATTDPVLINRRQSLSNDLEAVQSQIDNLELAKQARSGGARILVPAETPVSPIKPAPRRTAAVALVVGLILGVGLAFLREYLDDSIKDKDDVERALPGLSVLGLIPAIKDWKDAQRPMIVSATDPKSPAAEAYRSLRTSIQFLGLDRPMRVIQVTSPASTEGKTTTLANLGVTLAQAGQRVVLVDCDLRRPRLHEFFGLDNEVGFTSVLLGDAPLSAALKAAPGMERVAVMTAGPLPPNPSELLASPRATEVLTSLQGAADIVLVDSPPMLPVTDAAVLSSRVDGMILVANARKTTGKNLERAYELLRQVEAPLIGAVLNGTRSDGGEYHYHYAYTYYGKGEAKPSRKDRKAAEREADASAASVTTPAG